MCGSHVAWLTVRTEEIEQSALAEAMFGGNEADGTDRKKTHREIMQEVISKSKAAKHQRQKEKNDTGGSWLCSAGLTRARGAA